MQSPGCSEVLDHNFIPHQLQNPIAAWVPPATQAPVQKGGVCGVPAPKAEWKPAVARGSLQYYVGMQYSSRG